MKEAREQESIKARTWRSMPWSPWIFIIAVANKTPPDAATSQKCEKVVVWLTILTVFGLLDLLLWEVPSSEDSSSWFSDKQLSFIASSAPAVRWDSEDFLFLLLRCNKVWWFLFEQIRKLFFDLQRPLCGPKHRLHSLSCIILIRSGNSKALNLSQ